MSFEIFYDPHCWEDLKGTPKQTLLRIKHAVETRLGQAPERFGKPLKGVLHGKWRLRFGDYRIIYLSEGRRVIILRIGHRSEVYR